MAVSVEKISNLERRMTISVPLAPLEGQIRQRLSQISRTAKFAGFRPGKAPIGLVNQHYGDQVRDEVYSKAVETSFGDAVEENKLRVAGFPNIEHKPFAEAAQDFEYTATFEVLPEIQLKDLSKVKIEQPALEVADADVEKTLDVLVKQRVTFEPVKRAAKKGDRINIALIASIDGKEVERTADNGIDLVLGEPGRMADFDDALLGGKAGATKTFEIAYPADHNPAQLAGKTVSYEVTFNTVSQPVLPPVDAEFAKSLGVEDGNIATMKTEIKASLTQEVEKRVKARVKEAVFQALIAEAEFEAPKAIVGSEINRLMQVTAQNLQQRGMDPKAIQLEPAMFEEQAKRNAALRLILAEVVNTNNLQATPDQIRAMVDTFAQSFEKPAELVSWYYADVKRLDEPAALATEENVVNWVLNQAKVTNKKIKFDELMAGA
jgi:trigger factor